MKVQLPEDPLEMGITLIQIAFLIQKLEIDYIDFELHFKAWDLFYEFL